MWEMLLSVHESEAREVVEGGRDGLSLPRAKDPKHEERQPNL